MEDTQRVNLKCDIASFGIKQEHSHANERCPQRVTNHSQIQVEVMWLLELLTILEPVLSVWMCRRYMCARVHGPVWVHVEAKSQHKDNFFKCFTGDFLWISYRT